MDKIVIEAAKREAHGKGEANRIRKAGRIPAVMYNSKGESTMLDVDSKEFNRVWRKVSAMTLITLKVDGKEYSAFIKDTDYNLMKDAVLHTDFYVPDADKEISAKFKVKYTGTAQGVLKGGYLLKRLPEVRVKAVAASMPHEVVVDISSLNIGDTLKVKDLKFSKGVSVITDGEAALLSIKQAH